MGLLLKGKTTLLSVCELSIRCAFQRNVMTTHRSGCMTVIYIVICDLKRWQLNLYLCHHSANILSSVKSLSHVRLLVTPWTVARQAPYPSPTSGVYTNSCPLSPWCHPDISSSVIPFSSCPQSLIASESFPRSQFFSTGGQSTTVSALASVLPMNIQDWFPLGWTGLIFLQSKGLSGVFSNSTVKKH